LCVPGFAAGTKPTSHELLPAQINTTAQQFNAFIAPDESCSSGCGGRQ
jgi:hypothetical protein